LGNRQGGRRLSLYLPLSSTLCSSSKRAREERALAAERRLQTMRTSEAASSSKTPEPESDSDDYDEEVEFIETDVDRKNALRSAEQDDPSSSAQTGYSWEDFKDDFLFTNLNSVKVEDEPCDLSIQPGNSKATSCQPHASLSISANRIQKPEGAIICVRNCTAKLIPDVVFVSRPRRY
jgi:hypothetical protein